MKSILVVLFICISSLLNAQIITTVDSIGCYDINDAAFDVYGNLYFVSGLGNQVLKMDTNYITSVVAGTGSSGFSGDSGLAINAKINTPGGIALDTIGNVYFTDSYNQRIRKIDIATGIISTIAGTGLGGVSTGGFFGDSGPALAAKLNVPAGICFDKSGNLYVADAQNYRIRKISTDGIINTIVGNGIEGFHVGDNGPAIAAECYPVDIIADNVGNLFFTQPLSTIRKVDASGVISTIAGDTISHMYNGDGIQATDAKIAPYSIAIGMDGLLYISDAATNNRVRVIDNSGIIHTVAGNGISEYSGDNGPANSAGIYGPSGIAFDHCGNLYIGQVNNPRIRKVSFNPNCWALGIEEIKQQTEIAIYPNPVIDELHIDQVHSQMNYNLFSIIGILERKGLLTDGNNTLHFQSLPTGVYILQLTDEEGNKTVKKIVKE